MKTIRIPFFIFLISNILGAQVQESDIGKGVNVLSSVQYQNILISGLKISDYNSTNGKKSKIERLLGFNFQEKKGSHHSKFIELFNDSKGLSLYFEDGSDTGDYYSLTRLNVNKSTTIITILGKDIKIGDDISNLGDIKKNTSEGTINFTSTESSFYEIRYDVITNKIVSISYEVFT